MRKIIIICLLALFIKTSGMAQVLTPVKWSYAAKKLSATEAVLLFRATIEDGWHIYSVNQGEGGPVKTSFTFTSSSDYNKTGKVTEPKPHTSFDKTFGINVSSFEKEVIFQQKIKLKAKEVTVKGSLEYMVCNDHQCLPPETVEFSIPVK